MYNCKAWVDGKKSICNYVYRLWRTCVRLDSRKLIWNPRCPGKEGSNGLSSEVTSLPGEKVFFKLCESVEVTSLCVTGDQSWRRHFAVHMELEMQVDWTLQVPVSGCFYDLLRVLQGLQDICEEQCAWQRLTAEVSHFSSSRLGCSSDVITVRTLLSWWSKSSHPWRKR